MGLRTLLGAVRPRNHALGWAAALVGALLAGCLEGAPPVTPTADPGLFDHPQALIFAGDWLVVANTHYRATGWTGGDVVVLDPVTGAVVNRIPTSTPNPQALAIHGDTLLVLATGALDLGDFDRPQAATDGALDGLPITTLATASAPAWSLPVPRQPAAAVPAEAPVDLAVVGDRALITSGVSNAVIPVNLAARRLEAPVWLGAPDVGLGSVQPWRERFAVVDFNSDRLTVVEADGTPWPCAVDLGVSPGNVEGPGPLSVQGDDLYVVLTFSSTLRHVDLGRLDPAAPGCGAQVTTVARPVGNVPNDLHVRGDAAWVVDSGDNNLVAYSLADGKAGERVALAPGANPWHAAWRADGRLLAVTEWAAHGVTLRDMLTGAVRRVGADATPVAPPPAPADAAESLADAVVDAPGADPEADFGDPARAANGVRGAGDAGGSFDVYSIPAGEHLVLGWGGRALVDGPGPDLVVFENAFRSGGPEVFMELAVVELSPDGERWVAFPHAYLAEDPTVFVADPAAWVGFAGRTPVRLHAEDFAVDPFDPQAGGDRFDLADLPAADAVTAAILTDGARFVRLSAAADHLDPRTGEPFVTHPAHTGPDIDGVAARWLVDR
ncbi:MAG: LIC_13355 family lipoprotein [Myxococcales bacterium]|nr:LIC_13355 family lipoprotein [Myxococcales bacterium]